ncbi:MAG: hypothetical protein GEU75_15145 [Dehalococcoidia bacterium]|nr:hypothetical protein [Dehalococcoidia bacterium]
MSRRARAVSPRPNPLADLDPERRNAVLLVGGIGAVVLFALALIGYGYYTDRIAPNRTTVLEIGDRKFDYSFLERRVGAEYAEGNIQTTSSEVLAAGIIETLSLIDREETVRQAARKEGLVATQDEVDAAIKERLGLTAEATREAMAPRLRSQLLTLGLPLSEYEEIARAAVLEEKYRSRYADQVPAQADHVDLRIIQVGSKVTADSIKTRLDNGESFASIAAAESIHPSGRGTAGELGWVPRGSQIIPVEEAAWDHPGLSGPIETIQGFFIVENRGQETRDLTDTTKEAVARQSLTRFLESTREELGANPTLSPRQLQRIASSIVQRGS